MHLVKYHPEIATMIGLCGTCLTFATDSATEQSISFLREDPSVQCYSDEHREIILASYVLMVIWPIGMPLLYLALLLDQRSRRSGA